MFGHKPFKDAEVNPNPPSKDLQDYIELTFRFFWFYRRPMIGLVLVGAVAVWCYYLAINPRSESAPHSKTVTEKSFESNRPTADLNFEVVDDPDPKEESDRPVVALPSKRSVGDPESPMEKLLTSGKAEQLIEQSLKLHTNWNRKRPDVALMMSVDRAKISRRLLDMKLSESERTFALMSYIESISQIDSLNVLEKMKVTGTRDALLEIDNLYTDHTNSTVSASANLAMVKASMNDFVVEGSLEQLNLLREQLEKRFNLIAQNDAALTRLAETAAASLLNNSELPAETRQLIDELIARFDRLKSEPQAVIARALRDHVYFAPFEMEDMGNLILQDTTGIHQQVALFFDTLDQHPDSSLRVYKTAIDIVTAYRMLGKVEQAETMTQRLNGISDGIVKESDRLAVKDAIANVRSRVY